MPTVPLVIWDDSKSNPNTRPACEYAPHWRVRVRVKLGGRAAQLAILDTGAPVSVLSKQAWSILHLCDNIEWVCPDHVPGRVDHDRLPKARLLGGEYPYRLGRIWAEPVGLSSNESLPPTCILAHCTEDVTVTPTGLKCLPAMILLGLAGGVLLGRQLTLSASACGTQWNGEIGC